MVRNQQTGYLHYNVKGNDPNNSYVEGLEILSLGTSRRQMIISLKMERTGGDVPRTICPVNLT